MRTVPTEAQGSEDVRNLKRRLRALPLSARLLAVPLIILMAGHIFITGLWVAPSTPLRDEIGQERVQEYIYPWFEQNWSLFAPTPRRGEVIFEVRAFVENPETGMAESTEWVKLTDIEDSILSGNFMPPRTIKLTRRIADDLHSARGDMNEQQLELLGANFFETPISELRTMLLDVEGGSASAVEDYMRADESATLVASAYAEHTWGTQGDITRVQYRTSSRRVPLYTDQSGKTLEEVEPTIREYGWRHALDLTDEQVELFAQYAGTETE